jgi:mRNA interferase HicA
MKIKNFIKFLNLHNCPLLREGANHSVFKNQTNNKISSVPRHKEVK